MTTQTKSRDYYIEKIKKHLLKKYPGMRFEIEHVNDRETYIYCYAAEPIENGFDITQRAGNIVTDALVDDQYRFYVMDGN